MAKTHDLRTSRVITAFMRRTNPMISSRQSVALPTVETAGRVERVKSDVNPSTMGQRKTFLTAIIMLSPLLVVYVGLVLVLSKSTFRGDEGGYVAFANNLVHGFYS